MSDQEHHQIFICRGSLGCPPMAALLFGLSLLATPSWSPVPPPEGYLSPYSPQQPSFEFVCPPLGFRVVESDDPAERERNLARDVRDPYRNKTVAFSSLASAIGCGIARLAVALDYGFVYGLLVLLTIVLLFLWGTFRIARTLAPRLERICRTRR